MPEQPEITVYSVPDCADCEAVKLLLKREGVPFTEKNVRGNPEVLSEMQAHADGVRIAPVTVIGTQAFYGRFEEQRLQILAALNIGL